MKTAAHWKPIGQRPHHGIQVPLFALHTQRAQGIGEFLDLMPLIDWCATIGFDTIQLLPLYDTGTDPSPYNPISSCALDPVYLSLPRLSLPSHLPRAEIKARKLDYLHTLERPNLASFVQSQPWVEEYGRFLGDAEFHCFVQSLCFAQMGAVKAYAE
ncbi:MAG: 4-alpha-glucanotransferase, partial [Chlamydiia bacterium]|nr:4-alpha-glucanotransferase [Chlamydiia bacterium]